MWFSTLTYPVEQPYRLRWITEIFYAVSAVLVILLVTFNVALVGYEEVTILQKDPNITDYDQWWAPKSLPSVLRFRTKPGDCQEANLPLNTPLKTNSSLPLLTYYLTNNLNYLDSQKDSFGLRSETPYQANPMDICHVNNMTLTMEPKILSFVVSTTLICDPVGEPPRSRRFQTYFKRAQDDRFRPDSILDYMAYRASPNDTDSTSYQKISRNGPPKDPYANALGVVDALSTDLIHLMYMRKVTLTYINDTGDQNPPELGSMSWDSRPDPRPPTDSSRMAWGAYSDGWWDEGGYVRTMNVTIVNMLIAIRDAIYLDVGNIAPTNIYTNKTSFRDVIKIDNHGVELAKSIYEHDDWEDFITDPICSWGWGCTSNANITWAQEFTTKDGLVNNITLPIVLPPNRTASVIDIVYLCPQYRLKPWGNLLISVFTSTFTMYLTLFGIFAWLAPALDRKRKGPPPSERFIAQQIPSRDYELHLEPQTPRSSSYAPPYYTIDFEDDRKQLLDEDKEK